MRRKIDPIVTHLVDAPSPPASFRREIVTSFQNPPIPTRDYDWAAYTTDYEGGDPIGYGPTESAAIEDLLDQLEYDYMESTNDV